MSTATGSLADGGRQVPRPGRGRAALAAWMSRLLARRHLVAWAYLTLYGVAVVACACLPSRDRTVMVAWSSTNLINLHDHPVGALAASAFVPAALDTAVVWLVLGGLGLLPVSRMLRSARTLGLMVTAQVAGTLVSEGIVGARVRAGALPPSARGIIDVGPSYLVAAALVAAVLYGSRLERIGGAAGFVVVAVDGFRGLTHLDVAAVGHVTACLTGAAVGGLLLWSTRWRRPAAAGQSGARPAPR